MQIIRWFTILVIVVGQLLRGHFAIPTYSLSGSTPQKGISFVTWSPDDYQLPEAGQALHEIRQTGATWISLIVTQYQANIDSTIIQPMSSTPTDASLIAAIRAAHQIGLKVMLKPHIDLAEDQQHWRGEIGQHYTLAQWQKWFQGYKQFVVHYAAIAGQEQVDEFCVGTELTQSQGFNQEWRSIVADARRVYSGPIVYAANFGQEWSLSWWDAVDIIGVDAYYPLALTTQPTGAALDLAWKGIDLYLSALAARQHKKILFTEIGYRSILGTAARPGDYWVNAPVDLSQQEAAYRAAFENVYHQPWFAGMFWWAWGANTREGGFRDAGYTPRDKPAENILRSWFTGTTGG